MTNGKWQCWHIDGLKNCIASVLSNVVNECTNRKDCSVKSRWSRESPYQCLTTIQEARNLFMTSAHTFLLKRIVLLLYHTTWIEPLLALRDRTGQNPSDFVTSTGVVVAACSISMWSRWILYKAAKIEQDIMIINLTDNAN